MAIQKSLHCGGLRAGCKILVKVCRANQTKFQILNQNLSENVLPLPKNSAKRAKMKRLFMIACVLASVGFVGCSTKSLSQKCEAKDGESCRELSVEHYKTQDYSKAFEFAQKACDLKSAGGCFWLGRLESYEYNFAKVALYYEKSCDLKSASACYELGKLYETGEGVEKNSVKANEYYKQAFEYSKQACDLNDSGGCIWLGSLYENGRGIEKDLTKAISYYEKACDLKNGEGCSVLGWLYLTGQGIEKDLTKAISYYEKACDLKSAGGCFWLDRLEYDEENFAKAALYYEKSCDLKNPSACYELGIFYLIGVQGVKADENKSKKFFKKACDLDLKTGQAFYYNKRVIESTCELLREKGYNYLFKQN